MEVAPLLDKVFSSVQLMELFVSDIRGFMTSHGVPDCARSARYILKDYVKVQYEMNHVHTSSSLLSLPSPQPWLSIDG